MIDGLAVLVEAAGAIGHQPLALGFADFPAQVGFAGQAEFALATFGGIQGNNVIADGNTGNAFTNRLYNAAAFMAKDGWKVALGILTREGKRIGVAYTGCDHFYPYFPCFRGHHVHLFNRQWLTGAPGNCCF